MAQFENWYKETNKPITFCKSVYLNSNLPIKTSKELSDCGTELFVFMSQTIPVRDNSETYRKLNRVPTILLQ